MTWSCGVELSTTLKWQHYITTGARHVEHGHKGGYLNCSRSSQYEGLIASKRSDTAFSLRIPQTPLSTIQTQTLSLENIHPPCQHSSAQIFTKSSAPSAPAPANWKSLEANQPTEQSCRPSEIHPFFLQNVHIVGQLLTTLSKQLRQPRQRPIRHRQRWPGQVRQGGISDSEPHFPHVPHRSG